jgi:lysine-N-methylase
VSRTTHQKHLPTLRTRSAAAERPRFGSGVALRAIADFECLGSECEDTCCSGWSIPLSSDDLNRLRKAANRNIGTRRTFQAVVAHQSDGPVQGTAGRLTMGSTGRCSFLDEEQLCEIQKSSGPQSIPTVCGLYPRRMSVLGSRLELTPLMSCPEAARNLLLETDGADLVEVDPARFPRVVANHVVPKHSDDPFERHLDDVRGVMLQLLKQDGIPFEVRFFFTATLADGLQDFFGRGHPDFDQARLAATLHQFTNGETLAQLWAALDKTVPDYTLGASVAYQVIAPRAQGSRKLTELFARAMSTFGPESGLEVAFTERAAALDNLLGTRWDAYFTRFSINSWVQSYLESDTVLEHCRSLAIRLQTIRFLVLGDPQLEEARVQVASGAAPAGDLEQAFDAAFVRVVYRFARATEHDPEFWASVTAALDANGFSSFGHVTRLIPRRMAG